MSPDRFVIPKQLLRDTYGSLANYHFIKNNEPFPGDRLDEIGIMHEVYCWREMGIAVFVEVALHYLQMHPSLELEPYQQSESSWDEASCRYFLDEILRIGFGPAPDVVLAAAQHVTLVEMPRGEWNAHRKELFTKYLGGVPVIAWDDLRARVQRAVPREAGLAFAHRFKAWAAIDKTELAELYFVGQMKMNPEVNLISFGDIGKYWLESAPVSPDHYPYHGADLYWNLPASTYFWVYLEHAGHAPELRCRWVRQELMEMALGE